MEIVLRKRPLKNKVRLFNFCNSSQTSAKGSQTFAKDIKYKLINNFVYMGELLKFMNKTEKISKKNKNFEILIHDFCY